MKRSEKAAFENYLDNREAEIRGTTSSYPENFYRMMNDGQQAGLEGMESVCGDKKPHPVLTSDTEEIRRKQEERRLRERKQPRHYDVVLGTQRQPQSTDAVRGGIN